MKLAKFLRARFLQNNSGGCFWVWELLTFFEKKKKIGQKILTKIELHSPEIAFRGTLLSQNIFRWLRIEKFKTRFTFLKKKSVCYFGQHVFPLRSTEV